MAHARRARPRAARATGTSPGAHALRRRPGAAQGRPGRRAPVLRRPGGRRPDTVRRGAHRRGLRRARSPTGPGSIGFLREGERVVGVRVRDLETGARVSRSGPSRSSTPPACGPTTPRRWSASAASSTSGRPRASTWSCRGTASSPRTGLILRTEKRVLFVIPWGRHWIIGTTDTDWDLGQGPPGRVQRRHRLPARARQLGARHAADPRRRRGRLRRAAPAAGRRVRATSKLSREHTVGAPGARAGGRGGRQVHDVPGDGQGRRRRGGARPGPAGAGLRAPRRSRCSAPRGTARCGTPAPGSPPGTGLHVGAGRAPAATGTARWPRRCSTLVAADPSLGEPLRGRRRLPARPRSSTPPRTRAPGTSTTS